MTHDDDIAKPAVGIVCAGLRGATTYPWQPATPWHSMTHSPGPWTKCDAADGTCRCGLVWDATGEHLIATVVHSDESHEKPPASTHANWRLIAAAPELLEAVGDLLGWDNCECGHPACKRGAIAAAARALIARIEAP